MFWHIQEHVQAENIAAKQWFEGRTNWSKLLQSWWDSSHHCQHHPTVTSLLDIYEGFTRQTKCLVVFPISECFALSQSFRFVSVTFVIFKELVGSDGKLESADKSCVLYSSNWPSHLIKYPRVLQVLLKSSEDCNILVFCEGRDSVVGAVLVGWPVWSSGQAWRRSKALWSGPKTSVSNPAPDGPSCKMYSN